MKKAELKAIANMPKEAISLTAAAASGSHKNLATAQAELQTLTAELNTKLDELRAEYLPRIQSYESTIEKETANIKEKEATLRVWAEAHRDEFPNGNKSLKFIYGTLGFQNLKPAVDTLKGWTQPKAALALLRKKWGKQYVEVKYSLKKNDLIRDRAQIGVGKLATCGLQIGEAEEFYFTPKTETQEQLAAGQ